MVIIVTLVMLSFFIWIQTGKRKANRKVMDERNKFWEKERQANATRKTDISELNYITIPLDRLPFTETKEEELLSVQNSVKALSKEHILNLTGISNTDLKLKYGTANINFLSECDSNYTLLVQDIYKWGEYLYNRKQFRDAAGVLEFGVECKTDISKNYILLARIYKETDANAAQKIDALIQTAESLSTLMKDSIINSLKEIKLSTYLT